MDSLTCLCSMATRALLAELAETYERHTGGRVEVTAMGGVDVARRVRAGEGFDVVVLASTALAALAAEGFVTAGSRADVARSGMVAAVRAGLPRPRLADEADVARSGMVAAVRAGLPRPRLADEADVAAALRAAGRIAYSTGPSGDHLLRLVDRLGLGAELAGRLLQAPPGMPVAALLAQGRAELGVQQASELVGQPGIDLVGPLPPDCQSITMFTAGVRAAAGAPDAARGFIASLVAPEAAAAKRRHGMEPA